MLEGTLSSVASMVLVAGVEWSLPSSVAIVWWSMINSMIIVYRIAEKREEIMQNAKRNENGIFLT